MNTKQQNKLRAFIGNAAKCFDGISKISHTLLVFGQLFILCAMTAFAFYIIYARNSNNAEIIAYAFKTAKAFFDSVIAGLAVIWGGALFIDYAEKLSGEKS